jgi:hypothetical protein
VIRPALKDRIDVAAALDSMRKARPTPRDEGEVVAVTPIVQQYAMEAVALCVFGKDLGVGAACLVQS